MAKQLYAPLAFMNYHTRYVVPMWYPYDVLFSYKEGYYHRDFDSCGLQLHNLTAVTMVSQWPAHSASTVFTQLPV